MKHKLRLFPVVALVATSPGGNGASGGTIVLTAALVVLVVMVLMIFISKLLSWIHSLDIRNRLLKKQGGDQAAVVETGSISGEVNAAIAMAIYLYQNELHDIENTVLTIKKVSRTYSPWSSKIYGLRRPPR